VDCHILPLLKIIFCHVFFLQKIGGGMKRRVEEILHQAVAILDEEALLLLSDGLRTLCSRRARVAAERLFSTPELLSLIVEHFAHSQYAGEVLRLRRVNKCWLSTVPTAVKHLNFRPTHKWSHQRFEHMAAKLPAVHSLCTHREALVKRSKYCEGKANLRVTSLEILKPAVHDTEKYESFHLAPWPSLLRLRFRSCSEQIVDLGQCTSLTELDLCGAKQKLAALHALVNLRRLRLREFRGALNPRQLPALQYLDTDWPNDFCEYTGEGRLEAEGDEDEEREALDVYYKDCWNVGLEGRWKDGVFTGHGAFQIHDSQWCFAGAFVDGRREGEAEDYSYDHHVMRRGNWQCNRRHGTFDVYLFPSARKDSSDRVLVARENWEHDVCLSVVRAS
jgi:hypothetical protein